MQSPQGPSNVSAWRDLLSTLMAGVFVSMCVSRKKKKRKKGRKKDTQIESGWWMSAAADKLMNSHRTRQMFSAERCQVWGRQCCRSQWHRLKTTANNVGIQMHQCQSRLSPRHHCMLHLWAQESLRSMSGLKIYVQSILLFHPQDFDNFIQEIYEMRVTINMMQVWRLTCSPYRLQCSSHQENHPQTSSGEQEYSNPIWYWLCPVAADISGYRKSGPTVIQCTLVWCFVLILYEAHMLMANVTNFARWLQKPPKVSSGRGMLTTPVGCFDVMPLVRVWTWPLIVSNKPQLPVFVTVRRR